MLSQVVVNQPYANLGGNEGIGRKGGYYAYETHFPQLWKCESVRRWLRKKEDTTRAEYLARFEKFLFWADKRISTRTPDQFLEWANSQESGIFIQDLIDEYAESLPSKSNAHIATALLRSFLDRNACKQKLPKIDWDSTMNFTEGYSRAEIQKLLSYLQNPVHKLYVMISKDGGFRANDTLYIRYKHIQEDFEKDKNFVHVRFEKERYLRRKSPGRSFIGPNSIDLLKQLLSQEVVEKVEKDKEGKIIRKWKEPILKRDPEAKLFDFSYRNITKVIDRAKKDAGLRKEVQPSHGLRKFFENCLDRVGMDTHKKLMLEGHSAGTRDAYTSQKVDWLLGTPEDPGYEQAYQFLDLSESAAMPQQLLEQAKTIETLRSQLATKDAEMEKAIGQLKGEMAARQLQSLILSKQIAEASGVELIEKPDGTIEARKKKGSS